MAHHTVTAIPGDGVGPECFDAVQHVFDAAGVNIEFEIGVAGAAVFDAGNPVGVDNATIDSIGNTGVVLKGPLATGIGGGGKSANVTIRKMFDMYANIRPIREIPGVVTPFTGRGIDIVVIRENVEDLYAGIEHRQTADVAQCLKLISVVGCEQIVRAAFDYAESHGRNHVTCVTKANIMKLTEGELQHTFERVAADYPSIGVDHMLVDNCAHQLVRRPEQFDIIVTTNMNGDILSDLTAGLVGGLGLAASANLSATAAMFEAVHGTAPDIAGKGVVNPTAMLASATMMLRHLGEHAHAARINAAIDATFTAGILTGDLAAPGQGVNTSTFVNAIIERLDTTTVSDSGGDEGNGRAQWLKPVPRNSIKVRGDATIDIVGADIFIDSNTHPRHIGPQLEQLAAGTGFQLDMISNRGTQVWPNTGHDIGLVDHHRCRFSRQGGGTIDFSDLLQFAAHINDHGHAVCHIERLININGEAGYTKAQGQT